MRSTPENSAESPLPDEIEAAASAWLARRDRGLSAAEQDAYLEWLRADPRHARAVARIEGAWRALDQLTEWRPAHSARPNPDLLALPRRRGLEFSLAALALAAALAFGLFVVRPAFHSEATAVAVRHSEVRTLPDGSVVELNKGAEIDVDFSTPERRIRLVRGEAHFTVAKLGPERPFVVTAGDVRLRAVGTVFNVRLDADRVDVLVTEGKVRIDPPRPADLDLVNAAMLGAGERAVAAATTPTPVPPEVVAVSPQQIEEALAWQGLRLVFNETPLEDAIEEFNRHTGERFVVADRSIARIKIEGNFRADNAEAFVRLLAPWGIAADHDASGRVVLRAAR